MNALIEFAGKQYKVEEGSTIKVPYIDQKVGSQVSIDKILYLDDGNNKTVGTPIVDMVQITGKIESHGRERKVVVFKFKRRKGYQKKNTHRQDYTILKLGKLETKKKSAAVKKVKSSATKKTENGENPVKKDVPKTTLKKTPVKKTTKTKQEKE